MMLLLLSAGCSHRKRAMPIARDWRVLTETDWREHDDGDTYFVIQRLRPSWLGGRGAGSAVIDPLDVGGTRVQVYLDGVRSSMGVDLLRMLPAQDVLQIQYLSPIDASVRFGTNHGGGAILVITRAGR